MIAHPIARLHLPPEFSQSEIKLNIGKMKREREREKDRERICGQSSGRSCHLVHHINDETIDNYPPLSSLTLIDSIPGNPVLPQSAIGASQSIPEHPRASQSLLEPPQESEKQKKPAAKLRLNQPRRKETNRKQFIIDIYIYLSGNANLEKMKWLRRVAQRRSGKPKRKTIKRGK